MHTYTHIHTYIHTYNMYIYIYCLLRTLSPRKTCLLTWYITKLWCGSRPNIVPKRLRLDNRQHSSIASTKITIDVREARSSIQVRYLANGVRVRPTSSASTLTRARATLLIATLSMANAQTRLLSYHRKRDWNMMLSESARIAELFMSVSRNQ